MLLVPERWKTERQSEGHVFMLIYVLLKSECLTENCSLCDYFLSVLKADITPILSYRKWRMPDALVADLDLSFLLFSTKERLVSAWWSSCSEQFLVLFSVSEISMSLYFVQALNTIQTVGIKWVGLVSSGMTSLSFSERLCIQNLILPSSSQPCCRYGWLTAVEMDGWQL